ncbi:MAG: phosphoribosyltransferase family protein [Methanomassiliicoccales archaeon]|jgi:hypothetical protein
MLLKLVRIVEISAYNENSPLHPAARRFLQIYHTVMNWVLENDSERVGRAYLRMKDEGRNIINGKLTFLSMDDAYIWTKDWIGQFNEEYDLIVGIPRSGLFIANIIATKLNRPLATPEMVQNRQYWMPPYINLKPFKNILVVEDVTGTAKALERVRVIVNEAYPESKVTLASLMVIHDARNLVDIFYKELDGVGIYEWNLAHANLGSRVAMDLDGVLCENCPVGFDIDETKYVNWICNARPYIVPYKGIDFILTNRLEKYRNQTEEWLRSNGVIYRKLIMWDIPSKADRCGNDAHHKINMVLEVKPNLMIESSDSESREIWRATGVPTICTDTMRVYSWGSKL